MMPFNKAAPITVETGENGAGAFSCVKIASLYGAPLSITRSAASPSLICFLCLDRAFSEYAADVI